MLRFLVVEDADDKRAQLSAFLRTAFPHAVIAEQRSLQSGLRDALAAVPNVVILDMSMPTFDVSGAERGGRHKHFAGREFLRQLERRSIRTRVIVVSQLDTFGEPPNEMTLESLDRELRAEHATLYAGAVYYHATRNDWQPALHSAIEEYLSEGL